MESENGETIDQFYKVARVGRFVIEGYEQYVGTRTDYNITRPVKRDFTPTKSQQTVNEYIMLPDIVPGIVDRSLGISAIDKILEMFPDNKIFIIGYTRNLVSHLHNKTKYTGKYFSPVYTQWNDQHNMIKEDIYLNRLIANKSLKVLK